MKVFCDTSVLVAASVRQHPHFAPARTILESIASGHQHGMISAHSLGELYSALTSLPVSPRILPAEAQRIIDTNVRPHFQTVQVTPAMYVAAIEACVRQSLGGGKVYDALLLACARKAASDRIYTFNLGDFRRLAPDLADRIAAP
jgi:predicted nucleic acid-binding protein